MFLASASAFPLIARVARFAQGLSVWNPCPRRDALEVEIRNVALSATWAFAYALLA